MATELTLPDLGEGVEDADVLRVLVTEGQEIAVDDSVLEIETEKATVEVPSTVAGKVARVMVHEGDTIKPGQLLLLVDGAAAPAAPSAPSAPSQAASDMTPTPPAAPAANAPPTSTETAHPEPVEGRTPPATPVPVAAADTPPTPPPADAGVPAPPPPPPPPPGDRPIFAAPSLRKFAREIGVDLRDVIGTGPGGRITEDDVKHQSRVARAAPAAAPAAEPTTSAGVPPPAPLPDFSQWGEIERQPLSRLRRTVARNMATSWTHIPHVTLQHWADITAIEEMRQQYKERARQAGGNLTISVVMLKIAAAALRAHPKFNSSLDLESNELILKRYYHIGVAVDTDRGLVVPVIRDVDQKNIIELSVELNEISERARRNELTLDEMRGASFTVTNLGSLGTGFFSPIINHPEVAVLGLGRAERVPVWDDGRWVPRLRMPLSVVLDHRVIDGADGARFASWLVDAVDNPLLLALEG